MRKLDDGTYMYDTDQPYEKVIANVVIAVFLFALAVMFAFFAWLDWREFGMAAFAVPRGPAFYDVIACVSLLAFNLKIVREALKRRRQLKDGDTDAS